MWHLDYWLSLQWRHYERDVVSNHQHHDCLLNCLFRRKSKKTSELSAPSLCEGNSAVTGEFLAQRANNAENVSIWCGDSLVYRCYGARRCSNRIIQGYHINKVTLDKITFSSSELLISMIQSQCHKHGLRQVFALSFIFLWSVWRSYFEHSFLSNFQRTMGWQWVLLLYITFCS